MRGSGRRLRVTGSNAVREAVVALNVMIVGAESAAVQVLRGAVAEGHRVVAVLAEPTTGAGLARVAEELGLPVDDARRVKDPAFGAWIAERGIDLLLNVHSLSIAKAEVVSAPRIGSFNLHPGPLPAYAGLNVVTWAIANGETSHGVTLHWMVPGIDMGDIAYDARFPISDDDTGLSVFSECIRVGVPLVFELLRQAAEDPAAIPSRPHVGERRLYLRADVPDDGWIDWSRPARHVHDLIRASDFGPFPSPCGHPLSLLGSSEVGLVGSSLTRRGRGDAPPGTVGPAAGGAATIAAGDEWVSVRSVVVDGRRERAPEVLSEGARLAARDGHPQPRPEGADGAHR
jgi:UDP-4-amino-4-deoxy-L-arabinose formyltransferase/UDP-glucuronic acid dehydrogenase (UDP-4-keto-hexauronic acid decarboxylating)